VVVLLPERRLSSQSSNRLKVGSEPSSMA
jgi:hypothetical protein